jgi:4-hydroxy-2-oxoheptanedioate aldolase
MIEKKSAMDNLESILSVEGVDMVQFGPCDYTMSLGFPGEVTHPRVKQAETELIKMALRHGVRPRAEIDNVENAKKYIDLGVRDFSISTDVVILYHWLKKNAESLRSILDRI